MINNKRWHKFFMDTAVNAAMLSKYNGSHIGCVLVADKRIVSTGFNGYPSGVDDEFFNSLEREERLKYVIHAEENAILNAARHGVKLSECEAYVTHHPCSNCLVKLVNAGIKKVYYRANAEFESTWKPNYLNEFDIQLIPILSDNLDIQFSESFLDTIKRRQFESFDFYDGVIRFYKDDIGMYSVNDVPTKEPNKQVYLKNYDDAEYYAKTAFDPRLLDTSFGARIVQLR